MQKIANLPQTEIAVHDLFLLQPMADSDGLTALLADVITHVVQTLPKESIAIPHLHIRR